MKEKFHDSILSNICRRQLAFHHVVAEKLMLANFNMKEGINI